MAMLRSVIVVFSLFGLLSALVGCSWVKSWFPDKEKEYKYSTEIAPLDIPPDLSSSSIEDSTIKPVATAEQPRFLESAVSSGKATKQPAEQQQADTAVVRKIGSGALEIREPFPQAWRMVEKALTRKAVEITDRDRSRGTYYVLYQETDEGAAKEGTLWAEFMFLLGRGSKRDTEYRIILEESEGATNVAIADKEGVRMSRGPGIRLLNMIKDALETKESSD